MRRILYSGEISHADFHASADARSRSIDHGFTGYYQHSPIGNANVDNLECQFSHNFWDWNCRCQWINFRDAYADHGLYAYRDWGRRNADGNSRNHGPAT